MDRYGQPQPTVRVITFYGANSPIDGIVLDVLLRKHQRIRKTLGVAVPVPTDSAAVIDAILEGLITRGRHGEQAFDQLSLGIEEITAPFDARLELEWQNAADRERRFRTVYAQATIAPDEVHRELTAAQDATGAGIDVRRFITESLRACGATVHEGPRARLTADLAEADAALRDAIGLSAAQQTLKIARDGSLELERTNPIVQPSPRTYSTARWTHLPANRSPPAAR